MNKQFLLIIAAMLLLTPVATYSQPATEMKGHTPIDRSKTDTYSDGIMDQPMTDLENMKSDKMMDKSKTEVKSKKKTGKSISGTKSKKRVRKPINDTQSGKMMDTPVTEMPPEKMPENK